MDYETIDSFKLSRTEILLNLFFSNHIRFNNRGTRFMGLGSLIGGFIVILVGVNLIPVVSKQVTSVYNTTNVTGAASTILGLTTTFFAIGILVAGVSLAIGSLRTTGLIGQTFVSIKELKKKEDKYHKEYIPESQFDDAKKPRLNILWKFRRQAK